MNTFKKSFFGAAIGTMIEYYDYVLFITFLPILSPVFFPADSSYQSLVKGYFVLLIATIARPLGGLLFGYIGDAWGRRKALLGSMYGIALATFIIGITPSYTLIGNWALIIVVLAKSVQLFCFGGEYNGAGIYVVEHAQNKSEGMVGSLLTATTLFGALLASLIGIVLTAHFMPNWSWRIAFILGGVVGIFGIFYRKNLLESPHFHPTTLKKQSLKQLFKLYPRELFAAMCVGSFATVPFTTVLTFINPVLMTRGFFNAQVFMRLQTALLFCAVITLIIIGKVADATSPKKVMLVGCYCLILFSFPLLSIIELHHFYGIFIAEVGFVVINEIFLGPSNAYLKNLFAMEYRYRGTSLAFCFGMSFFGGITPIVENFLYQTTGSFSSIVIWLLFIGMTTLAAIYAVKSPPAAQRSN